MLHRIPIIGIIFAAFVVAFLPGCRSTQAPTDPLLVSRKPLKAEIDSATPMVAVHVEPALPSLPTAFLAARANQIEHHPNRLEAEWPFRSTPHTPPGVLTSHPRNQSESKKSHAAPK